ncbi:MULTISPECIES: hypothetical protein [Nitrospirillum]|uniref:Uncharacterized protein n=1 Tax=Nitrospirillum amazonense TaxID=28077 RepID=A0A560FW09_9PROT|nr:hypothetical protein [Nitrospirillum amazonense]MEC4592570.1 hypothetical protein [Nitrospirillum amazonense]TWB25833.1 hypothetical protein FBZ88_109232 [Nitrospirillum amazonense]
MNIRSTLNTILVLIALIPGICLGHDAEEVHSTGNQSPAVGSNTGGIHYHYNIYSGKCSSSAVSLEKAIKDLNRSDCMEKNPTTQNIHQMNALDKAKLAILYDENRSVATISEASLACWDGDRKTYIDIKFSNVGNRTVTVLKYGDIKSKGKSISIMPYPLPNPTYKKAFTIDAGKETSRPFISLDDVKKKLSLPKDEIIYATSIDTDFPQVPQQIRDCSKPFGKRDIQDDGEINITNNDISQYILTKEGELISVDTHPSFQEMTMYSIISALDYQDIFGRKFKTIGQFHIFTVKVRARVSD